MITEISDNIKTPIVELKGFAQGRSIFLKREDLIHSEISGNKWRKLKYNMLKAKEQNYDRILTFGGAFSNHIAATAAAGKLARIKTIGLIRGEEHLPLNPTLAKALENDMELHYISRTEYAEKEEYDYIDGLRAQFGRFLLVPEGGSNFLGINGCTEILDEDSLDYDIISVAVGTGGTLTGLALSKNPNQVLFGVSALKGVDYSTVLRSNLASFISNEESSNLISEIKIVEDQRFGGYAKITAELMEFMEDFHEKFQIMLDPVYTGKMMFELKKRIESGYFSEGNKILAIHTGGLQGLAGFEARGIIKGFKYLG